MIIADGNFATAAVSTNNYWPFCYNRQGGDDIVPLLCGSGMTRMRDNQLRNYMSFHWSLHDSLEIYFRAIFHNMVCKSTERWQLASPSKGYPIRHGLAQFEAHSCCRGALNCRKKCSRDCIVDCACVVAEERKLADKERPLFVQLNWGKDDREGRFLLRNEDHNKNIPVRRQVYCHLSKLSAPSNRI